MVNEKDLPAERGEEKRTPKLIIANGQWKRSRAQGLALSTATGPPPPSSSSLLLLLMLNERTNWIQGPWDEHSPVEHFNSVQLTMAGSKQTTTLSMQLHSNIHPSCPGQPASKWKWTRAWWSAWSGSPGEFVDGRFQLLLCSLLLYVQPRMDTQALCVHSLVTRTNIYVTSKCLTTTNKQTSSS